MKVPSLAFSRYGHEGGVCVLVHGWCCRRQHMVSLATDLATDHTVFAIDLPGHGGSPEGESADFSVMAEAVVDFLDEYSLADVWLVGHSMGGVLSLITASRSSRVAGVINVDGAFPLSEGARAGYAGLFDRIREQGYRGTLEPYLREAFFLPQERGAMADQIIAEMLETSESWAVALLEQFPGLSAAPLGNLKLPILYLGSDRPRFDTGAVKALRPATEIHQITGAGHFLPIFATGRVAAAIREFQSR